MALNTFARKGGLVLFGGGCYVMVAGITYSYVRANKLEQLEKENQCSCHVSYVTRPDRNDRYNEIAKDYDSKIGTDEFLLGMNLLRRSLLYFNARGTVLEIGAGTGRNLPYYPDGTVDRVVLCDNSNEMLDEARKKVRAYYDKNRDSNPDMIRYAFRQGDSASLGFAPDDSFDTVIDTFGLCSYDDPVAVLKEMQRVCKKEGGKILLLEHGRSKKWDWITNYLDKHAERHAKNWGCVWNRDLDSIIEKSGLEIERVHTWHFATTYYVVCRPNQNAIAKALPTDSNTRITTAVKNG